MENKKKKNFYIIKIENGKKISVFCVLILFYKNFFYSLLLLLLPIVM